MICVPRCWRRGCAASISTRVRYGRGCASAPSARKFFDAEATWAPERDFELCTDVDRFDFVLRLAPAAAGPAQLQALAA
jgi:hypothetical protein